jgi:transcription initiation factor IIE alpha subunit
MSAYKYEERPKNTSDDLLTAIAAADQRTLNQPEDNYDISQKSLLYIEICKSIYELEAKKKKLKPIDLTVYAIMKANENPKDGLCWLSSADITKLMGRTTGNILKKLITIQKSLKRLHVAKLITYKKHVGNNAAYTIYKSQYWINKQRKAGKIVRTIRIPLTLIKNLGNSENWLEDTFWHGYADCFTLQIYFYLLTKINTTNNSEIYGTAFPLQKTIAKETGWSEKRIREKLLILEDKGLTIIKPKYTTSVKNPKKVRFTYIPNTDLANCINDPELKLYEKIYTPVENLSEDSSERYEQSETDEIIYDDVQEQFRHYFGEEK